MTNIKVYSTPTCPWCHKMTDYLTKKEIDFENIDVSTNHEAANEMIEKSGQMGVPQIEINGKIIVGFNQVAIDVALEKMASENNTPGSK